MGFKEDFPELLSNYFDVFSSQGVPQDTTDQQCSSCFSQTAPFHSHKHIPAKCSSGPERLGGFLEVAQPWGSHHAAADFTLAAGCLPAPPSLPAPHLLSLRALTA